MATAKFRPGFLLFIHFWILLLLWDARADAGSAAHSAAKPAAQGSASQPLLGVMEKELVRAKTALAS